MKYLILSCALVLASCTPADVQTQTGSVMPPPTEAATGVILQEPEAHPVSLRALRDRTPDAGDFTVGRVLEKNAVYTRYYITYRSGSLTISGIMNVPEGPGPFPLVVMNHGHIDTSVYTNGRGLRREQDYFARNGYVVLHPDYRNHAASSKDTRDELAVRLSYVEDAINAVAALHTANLPYLDKERVYMIGHSMGGGVTLGVLVTHPELVDAAVLYAPVTGNMQDNYERWMQSRPGVAEKIGGLYGLPKDAPEFWAGLSAESLFNSIKAPILIFHGTADKDVPFAWSERTKSKLEAAGKQVELVRFEGEGHEFGPRWGDFMRESREFFDATTD